MRITFPRTARRSGCLFSPLAVHASKLLRLQIWTVQLLRFLSLFLCTSLFGLVSDRTIGQFMHTSWTAKDRAPSAIRALAQTEDGFLWLGTNDGLYRFDGVTFERFEPPSGATLPDSRVRSLLALPNGDLWIGFQSGVISVVHGGRAVNYTEGDGVPAGRVSGLAQDRNGTMWAATSNGLARLEGNRWKQVGKDWNFPGRLGSGIFVDSQGTLWVATEDTIVFLPAGARQFQTTGAHVGQVLQIAEATNGKLWMAETTRSVRPVPLNTDRGPSSDPEVRVGSGAILFDQDGALWITTLVDGILRAPSPEMLQGKIGELSTAIESFTSKDGLSDDNIHAILQDREGNIWVSTDRGLDRFRKTNIIPNALPFSVPRPVLAAGDGGDVWIGDEFSGRLVRIHDGRSFSERRLDSIQGAYRDPDGTVWWVGPFSVYRSKSRQFSRLSLPKIFSTPYPYPMRATKDHAGALWLAAGHNGLFRFKNGNWTKLSAHPELEKSTPTAAFTDWEGRVWLGYEGRTIFILNQSVTDKQVSYQESTVGNVKAINGAEGHVWIGGDLGLAFSKGDHFHLLTPADTVPFRNVLGLVETSGGDLWMCEKRGVIHIASTEVRKALDDPAYRVKYDLFDSSDGLPGSFIDVTDPWPTEIQATDGRVWFVAANRIASIDPSTVFKNAMPPPVVIRSVSAEGKPYSSLTNLVLPALTRSVQIGYTGLSFSVPERVHFRYKLQGVDKDWQDAGTRREAFYNNLRPGTYRFRVLACNHDGVWNEVGAALDFVIAPTWYQTNWFLTVCIAAGGFVLWALYQLRMRKVARVLSARFDERLAERTRVARELHDTLLQTVQGSKMIADDALEQSSDPERMRRALEQLSVWLGHATQEERAALNFLRNSTTAQNDLAEAFRRALEDCRRQRSLEASFSLDGNLKEMHPVVRDEVYRIGYEAIRNACAHSQGSRLNVKLIYAKDLTLCVTDDGIGIDPAFLDRGKEGHYGLLGMRERATRIGGQLNITSSKDAGTEVKLVIPGRIIFRPRKRHGVQKNRSQPWDKDEA